MQKKRLGSEPASIAPGLMRRTTRPFYAEPLIKLRLESMPKSLREARRMEKHLSRMVEFKQDVGSLLERHGDRLARGEVPPGLKPATILQNAESFLHDASLGINIPLIDVPAVVPLMSLGGGIGTLTTVAWARGNPAVLNAMEHAHPAVQLVSVGLAFSGLLTPVVAAGTFGAGKRVVDAFRKTPEKEALRKWSEAKGLGGDYKQNKKLIEKVISVNSSHIGQHQRELDNIRRWIARNSK